MEYSQNKINKNISNIDFELDLTSDNKVYYTEKQNEKKEKENQMDKIDINFIVKLIDFGFFLSGFVFVYAILKINSNKKKKIKYKKENLKNLYKKKIYKKKNYYEY